MSLTPVNRQEEWYQQMINASTGNYLPSITAQDIGKVMTVESDLSYGLEDIPSQLPTVQTTDKDKFLHTNASTGDLEWSEVQGGSDLPAVTASDAGKVLTVQASATKGAVIAPEQELDFDGDTPPQTTDLSLFTVGATVIVTYDNEELVGTVIDGHSGEANVTVTTEDGDLSFYTGDGIINYSAPSITGTHTIAINLASVSGVWVASMPSSGGGVLVVHDVDGTLDKTWQEIHDAMLSGGAVISAYDGTDLYVVAYADVAKNYNIICYSGASIVYTTDSASGYPTIM